MKRVFLFLISMLMISVSILGLKIEINKDLESPNDKGGVIFDPARNSNIIEHVVQPGDTIWSIMRTYNIDEATIAYANNLSTPYKLKVGQKLIFPSVPGLIHTVRSGDTVYDISRKYHVPHQSIVDINELHDGSIKIGQILVIPGGLLPEASETESTSNLNVANSIGFVYPVLKNAIITKYYDARGVYAHYGWDWGLEYGTSVKASACGVVTIAGANEGYGLLVVIDHDEGFQTYYAFLSKLLVSPGDIVEQGEVIALSGELNHNKYPGLHFEVRVNGKTCDPLRYIRKDRESIDTVENISSLFPNQPLGWLGWSWGTPLQEVAGWLNYDSHLGQEGVNSVTFFTRQSETKSHIGLEWDLVSYGFIDNSLQGISLLLRGISSTAAADKSLLLQYGEPSIHFDLGSFNIEIWKGKFSSVLRLFSSETEKSPPISRVFIGTNRYIRNIVSYYF